MNWSDVIEYSIDRYGIFWEKQRGAELLESRLQEADIVCLPMNTASLTAGVSGSQTQSLSLLCPAV